MRILFVGESWIGSSARSLREALTALPGVVVCDIGQDQFLPMYRGLVLRLANRLLRGFQLVELDNAVRKAVASFRPDVLVIYKGTGIRATMVIDIHKSGIPVVNVFPDYSPHAYSNQLKEAMGCYDLVISTKPFHPALWKSVYGYHNKCVCVPHGYDPSVHLWDKPESSHIYDVALCATWRPEYHELLLSFNRYLGAFPCSVAIAGNGWGDHMRDLPANWHYLGVKAGTAYGDFLRAAKICISPVNRDVTVRGVRQPGDEDTTRTYELAAAYCFFVHQRTEFVSTIYDEMTEVPMWGDARELAELVKRFLPLEAERRGMAVRAHQRAVPAYSIPSRALQVHAHLDELLTGQAGARR